MAECIHFGICGGCSYQDLPYETQLELKRKWVEEALCHPEPFARHSERSEESGGLEGRLREGSTTGDSSARPQPRSHQYNKLEIGTVPEGQNDTIIVRPTIPSPKIYGYRHSIALSVKRRQGKLHMGFIGHDRRSFLPIESCPISDHRINQFLPLALQKLEALPPERKFNTSQVVLRVGTGGNVVTSIRTDRGKHLECEVLGKKFSFSMSSFFQNNFSILERFIGAVRTFLDPTGAGTLFDLYSGVGLIGILLADSYQSVIGIEEGYEAVKFAVKNAANNQVENISFIEGKVENLLSELMKESPKPMHVVVDPPRTGLKPEVIDCLKSLPIRRLVYVSCHLEALKRDLALLANRFQVTAVQPLDFFPQTKHIETLVVLEDRK